MPISIIESPSTEVIDTRDILKKDFFKLVRGDSELRSIFTGKSPDNERRRASYSDRFTLWMNQYNEGRKSMSHFTAPINQFPTSLIGCAQEFGYRGKRQLLPAWTYLRYLLQEERISEFVDDHEVEGSIEDLIISTLTLVQHVIEMDRDTHANEVRELQLQQLLEVLGGDLRGLGRSKHKVKSIIDRAVAEVKKGDESRWNQDEIVGIVQSIVRNID